MNERDYLKNFEATVVCYYFKNFDNYGMRVKARKNEPKMFKFNI